VLNVELAADTSVILINNDSINIVTTDIVNLHLIIPPPGPDNSKKDV
jgi:hypothetical protein